MSTAKKRLVQEAERVNPIAPVHIWRSPAGAAVDVLIVAHLSAYSAMHQHASEALPNETGGFLIGRVAYDYRDGCWHLEIEQAVPVEPVSQNPMHFTFTWRDVDRVRNYREEHGKALIGWYHTHPDLPVFLSETDLERTHRVLFSEPFQIALVYDPVRSRAGYFFWEGAQKIDASEARWREFDIAVTPDAPGGAGSESAPDWGEAPAAAAADQAPRAPRPSGPEAERPADPKPPSQTSDTAARLDGAAVGLVAAQPVAAPVPVQRAWREQAGEPAPPTDTQIHRLRLSAIDPQDTNPGLPARPRATPAPLGGRPPDVSLDTNPLPMTSPARAVAAAASPTPRLNMLTMVLVSVLLVLMGLAVGYFWFAPGNG